MYVRGWYWGLWCQSLAGLGGYGGPMTVHCLERCLLLLLKDGHFWYAWSLRVMGLYLSLFSSIVGLGLVFWGLWEVAVWG